MNKQQLEAQFEALKKDVSGLVDTVYFNRFEKDEAGRYYLGSKKEVKNNKDRVSRIIGSIKPEENETVVDAFLRKNTINPFPEGYVEIRKTVIEEQRQCVTKNAALKQMLLLLRLDGVLEFGKTPLCGTGNPVDLLREIMTGSHMEYKDTLLALLDDLIDEDAPMFISDDPSETPGEKFDKAVMLLSLLSKEDILDYGMGTQMGQETGGNFCNFFFNDTSLATVLPLIMHGSPEILTITKDTRLKTGFVYEEVDAIVDYLKETLEMETWGPKCIAFDSAPYRNILLQCANSGVSTSGWVKKVGTCIEDKSIDVSSWMLEHIDSKIAEVIMHREGYYTLSLADGDIERFESGEEFYELRKYIVDNGYLKDVWYSCEEGMALAFYEINTHSNVPTSNCVRFFNYDNIELIDNDSYCYNLQVILCGFDIENENLVYRFISSEAIVGEGYRLNMGLYNSNEYARCTNPVMLRDIFTPVDGSVGAFEMIPYRGPIVDEGSVNVTLCDSPLDNYSESLKAGHAYRMDGDMKFITNSAIFVRNIWPMKPSYMSCKNIGEDGGMIVSGEYARNTRAYKIDTSRAYPWFVAYKLSEVTYQFSLRRNKDGVMDESQFLKMFIDLPSLEEQEKEVEEVIKKEIERKKHQVGAVDALFNLSHTIGLPASRIQSLLGNLQDMCMRNQEISSQLKKVADNFDYIIRVIDTTSKDFSRSKEPLKECYILPVLESFISAFSSLPFGIDPVINKSRINQDTRVKIDKTLFYVMMDNILRNACRHGFEKKISCENKIAIDLDIIQYKSTDYLLLSVCNNGKPMENGFTVYDYTTRGKRGKQTGNTGHGGYDIFQIVKKFNGYLGLRSDEKWNFIIDILIPVVGYDSDIIKTNYTHGALL